MGRVVSSCCLVVVLLAPVARGEARSERDRAVEPPPPPLPRHRSPRRSLLVGVRAGWLLTEGHLWARGLPYANGQYCCRYEGEPWSRVSHPGPKLELNLGARFERFYQLFGIWEHAFLPGGDGSSALPEPHDTHTNFYGLGLRVNSDPDDVGLLLELALGYRDLHAQLGDGRELDSNLAFNARIGFGVGVRINHWLTLSPLLTFGGGSFSELIVSEPDGSKTDQISEFNVRANHTPIAFEIGGVFDVLSSR